MSKKKGYYISLGAGHNQLDLIKAAKEQQYLIIGVDQDINAVGMALCDIRIEESILNYRKIHAKILKLALEQPIIACCAATYGTALLSAAFLVEHFNLEGLHRYLIEILSDKLFLREKLLPLSNQEDSLFLQPNFFSFHSKIKQRDFDSIGYPLLLKKRDGHGKKNIFLVETPTEAKQLLKNPFLTDLNISLEDFIIENIIPGDEITVVGFVQNFQFHLISISDKITSPYPPFIELEHHYPSKFQDKSNEIINIHQAIVEKLQLNTTPLVSEWKYHNGKFYLIEISPQIPGEYLATKMIPTCLKYDFFANLVSLTTSVEIEKITHHRSKSMTIRYFEKKPEDDIWHDWEKKSKFTKILNSNPHYPALSNADRYGVMIFMK